MTAVLARAKAVLGRYDGSFGRCDGVLVGTTVEAAPCRVIIPVMVKFICYSRGAEDVFGGVSVDAFTDAIIGAFVDVSTAFSRGVQGIEMTFGR